MVIILHTYHPTDHMQFSSQIIIVGVKHLRHHSKTHHRNITSQMLNPLIHLRQIPPRHVFPTLRGLGIAFPNREDLRIYK